MNKYAVQQLMDNKWRTTLLALLLIFSSLAGCLGSDAEEGKCNDAEGDTQEECEANGGTWSMADNQESCYNAEGDTQEECEANGGTWGTDTNNDPDQNSSWEEECEDWEYWNQDSIDPTLPGNGCPHYQGDVDVVDDPENHKWQNNTARFVYIKPIPNNNANVQNAKPYELDFAANPMAEQNPVIMNLICSLDDGHTADVWSAYVLYPFNNITSWMVYNTNGQSLGKFVSHNNLASSATMEFPTVLFEQNDSASGHIQAEIIDQEAYDCELNDSDNDSVSDNVDQCPNTPAGEMADANGCSSSQLDSDNDGVMDSVDLCPNTPAGETVETDGCSTSQTDSDGDGVMDDVDQCPNTPAGETVDDAGCSNSESDADGDGVSDDLDAFPQDPHETTDTDGDGIGNNADTDDDGDMCLDHIDAFPLDESECFDLDSDGIGDNSDNDPWLDSPGNGSFDMAYEMVGLQEGHSLYWLGNQYYAYYYSATPDHIWTDGKRSKVTSHNNLPNVDAVLSQIGLGIENLTVSTSPKDLGQDIENQDWGYDSNTKIEWRNLSSSACTLYVDGQPLFSIDAELYMYLDYSDLMASWGQDPVTMWGNSSKSNITILAQNNVLLEKLADAYFEDFNNGQLSYSFTSQDAIISNKYEWTQAPANATEFLEGLIPGDGNSLDGGYYQSINATVNTDGGEEQVGGMASSSQTTVMASTREDE